MNGRFISVCHEKNKFIWQAPSHKLHEVDEVYFYRLMNNFFLNVKYHSHACKCVGAFTNRLGRRDICFQRRVAFYLKAGVLFPTNTSLIFLYKASTTDYKWV